MSTFAVFLSFSFLFHSQNYTPVVLYEENLLRKSTFLYMTTFSVHVLEPFLFTSHGLYSNPIYVQRFFHFSQHTLMVHTKVSSYTLVAHTHKNSFPRIISPQKPSIHIFLLHTCINKKPFSLLYEHDFYSQRFFLFIRIFGSFYF